MKIEKRLLALLFAVTIVITLAPISILACDEFAETGEYAIGEKMGTGTLHDYEDDAFSKAFSSTTTYRKTANSNFSASGRDGYVSSPIGEFQPQNTGPENGEFETVKFAPDMKTATTDSPIDASDLDDVLSPQEESDEAVLQSFLPLREVQAYLVVPAYEEYGIDPKAVPLELIMNTLLDSEGNTIPIAQESKVVWSQIKDESGNIIKDEYHLIGKDETVDLSLFENVQSYTLEMIVGDGTQLNPNNVRYITKVYLKSQLSDFLTYELYTQDSDGTRRLIIPRDVIVQSSEQRVPVFDIPVTSVTRRYLVPEHVKGTEYYLGIHSILDEHPFIKVEVYTGSQFSYEMYSKILPGVFPDGVPMTDEILNQDMSKANAGYKHTFDRLTQDDLSGSPVDIIDNYIYIVHVDAETGEWIGKPMSIYISVETNAPYFTDEAFTEANGQKIEVKSDTETNLEIYNANLALINGKLDVSVESYAQIQRVFLKEGYSPNQEYYYALTAHSPIWDNANAHVEKAVVGHYDTIEAAQGQPDIKEQLIPAEPGNGIYGYKANYNADSGGVYFTVFFKEDDGNYSIFKFVVAFAEYVDFFGMMEYDDAPIVGAADPWFRVTGIQSGEDTLDTYVIENGKDINMDTMYGYGYQTVFINDRNANLSDLKPIFWFGDAERVETYAVSRTEGAKQISGVSSRDFTNGTLQYGTIIDDNEKNYQVTIVKKQDGPRLFVNGPSERAIFLDEYFEYKHDILIANIGSQPLTGLRVNLNADNVKLDDYWTVGGENNDTLAAFETTTPAAKHGELPNLAKIRLRPDGEGDIDGTLTISADNQEDVVIHLVGRASNPEIVTERLDDGVKFVPYSYLVATNNMNEWNHVTFTLEDGALPPNLELKETTGEITGVPQETGTYRFTIKATYSRSDYFEPSSREFSLTIKSNTDLNVNEATNRDGEDYKINIWIPDMTLTSNAISSISTPLEGPETNTRPSVTLDGYRSVVFESNGELGKFIALWLDGRELEKDRDYTSEEGSTRNTIYSQTFQEAGSGPHTIAAEFREGGEADLDTPLKRTAQNYTVNISTGGSTGNSGNTGNSGSGNSGNNGGSSSGGNSGNSGGSSGGNSGNNGGSSGGTASTPYSINIAPTSNGSLSASRSSATKGTKITITAKPNAEYRVRSVRVAGTNVSGDTPVSGSGNTYTFNMPGKQVTISVVFEPIPATTYSIRPTSTNHGSFNLSRNNAAKGTSITVTTIPVAGYVTKTVIVRTSNGSNVSVSGTNNTRIFTMPADDVTVSVEFAPETLAQFKDIDGTKWFFQDAKWAYERGVIRGVTNTDWQPDSFISTATVVVTLARLTQTDLTQYWNSEYRYEWIPNDWYTAAARWAATNGFLTKELFTGRNPLPRGSLAVILQKFLVYQGIELPVHDSTSQFVDADVMDAMSQHLDEDVSAAFQIMNEAKVFRGYSDGKMNPQNNTTRAHLVVLLHRLSNFIIEYWAS